MAKPLNATSTKDVDGYLQHLIESLTEDESNNHGDEVSPSGDEQPSELNGEPIAVDVPTVSSGPSLSSSLPDAANIESGPSTAPLGQLEASTRPKAQSPVDETDEPTSPPIEKSYERPKVNLVPRPTGSPDTISELREVANLTVKDALNAHRCRELISSAYGMFAFALVCLLTGLLCSFFGVSQPGLARLVALASVALGGLGTLVYMILLFVISRSSSKSRSQ